MKKKLNKLSDFEKRNPFTVPDNYFEEFSENLLLQIAPRKVSLFEKTKPFLYFAAMFLGMFFILKFAVKELKTVEKSEQVVKIEQEQKYNEFLLSEIDDEILMEYLAEN